MKVLYIGGTGEISYSCIARGTAAGQDITVFNRGINDEPLPAGVQRIVGDLHDQSAYRALASHHWDVVCQFNAFDAADVQRDIDVFAQKIGQYVFISSASAYRKPPTTWLITEDIPVENPFWPYSHKKAQAEQALFAAHRQGKLPVTIVRPSHTYRRRFPTPVLGGDPTAWRLLNGRPVIMPGDGTTLWTITYSDDFAVPFVNLLGRSRALGEAFHITAHLRAWQWEQIIRAQAGALGVEPKIVHVPTDTLVKYVPEWSGPLYGDKGWPVVFDNSKVKSVAGDFDCPVGLEEGMRRVAVHTLKRLASFVPDEKMHALLDRLAAEQSALGG